MTRDELIGELLGFVERAEARLLSWGFYDISFSPRELEVLVQREASQELRQILEKNEEDTGEILEDLLDEMSSEPLVLYKTPDDPPRYRTRFAESVRLFGRLRQFFSPDEWSTGPRLVADLRVHIAPRRYPRRDRTPETCWADMKPHTEDPAFTGELFQKLTEGFDLAGFQQRAFTRIFREYGAHWRSGTVISAGTGSGKTKGFYVPALLRIAEDVRRDASPFVKVIAIYPRNVLLADQLREAIAEVNKMNGLLQPNTARGLSVGALLGPTPQEYWFKPAQNGLLAFENFRNSDWKRRNHGSVIPYLSSGDINSPDLIWLDGDRKAGSTRLVDEAGSERVADGVLRITREQLQKNPPDILFLSLEMLNKEIGNSDWWHGLGIDQPVRRRPRLLLLDEVHSYEGTPGAMASWALRRWQYRANPPELHVVGLSATLKDAAQHVSTMSGVRGDYIEEIRPQHEELQTEGAEYSLALKGDPASGGALLSTTIQAGMLLSRLLTPLNAPASNSLAQTFFGRKVFSFTDNLDSLNRWLPNMTDAESDKHLAGLRQSSLDDPGSPRDRDGQMWKLSEDIGHELNQALRVTRCSSQDPGVDANSNLIIATSALEVGFDDPDVGATLHHKKPISMSSFIQRKGRSGRRRGMRPWTVMVLSDYATDRWAFQNIERFFEPEIDSLRVPLENPYVLKAQGAMFLLDWLGTHIRSGSPYAFLAKNKPGHQTRQKKTAGILTKILGQGKTWEKFRNDLEDFFERNKVGLGSGDPRQFADMVLWEDPRPVLRQAIPELLKILESWTTAGAEAAPDTPRPLPTYVPATTFSQLAEGDVSLEFQRQGKNEEVTSYSKGLWEFCPGNVSKRYSTGQYERGYWLRCSPELVSGRDAFSVEELFPRRIHLGDHNGVSCFRPLQLEVEECGRNVSDRSTGAWEWSSSLQSEGAAWPVPVFERDRWSTAIRDMRAFMSREGGAIDVCRIASSFRYEVGAAGQEKEVRRAVLRCSDTGQPQGIAERRGSDGLQVRTRNVPIRLDDLNEQELLPSLRVEYFRQLARDEMLSRNLNTFLANRVIDTALSMLVVTTTTDSCELQDAQERLQGQRPEAATEVLNTILGAGATAEDDESDIEIAKRVAVAWADPGLCAKLEELEQVLWADPDKDFLVWLEKRNTETLAQSLRTAVLALAPECTENDFDLDIDWTPEGADVYITETSAGGVGHIERVVGAISSEPDRFEQAFSRALDTCPVDRTFRTLRTVSTAAARGSDTWLPVLAQARSANSFTDADDARRELRQLLMRSRLDATRSTVATVMNRVARPGTSELSDRVMHLVNEYWTRLESRTGISIDAQVVAYVLLHRKAAHRRLAQTLRGLAGGRRPETAQVRSFVEQLLIPKCRDACRDCLDHPSRYDTRVRPSRALAAASGLVPPKLSVEDAAGATWREDLRKALRERGDARLKWSTKAGDPQELSTELFGLLGETADAGTLLLPLAITSLEADPDGWTMRVSARSPTR